MVDECVTVKGTPVRSLQKFVDAELTPEQRERVFRNLPPEYGERFRSTIVATETIPVHMLNRFTEEAATAKGESVEEFARRAGREAAGEGLRGIYRLLAFIMTPPELLGKASPMWMSVYNRGEIRVHDQTDRSATIRLTDFPCEVAGCSRIAGWIETMAELTGVKDLRIVQTKCFAKGADCCEWSLTWK